MAASMVPASSAPGTTTGTATAAVRRTVGGLALTLVLATGLAACGGKDDSATDTGGSSSAPASTAAPASAGGPSASSTSAPASGGSATTTPAAGATATTAAGATFDTVPEAEVAEMERTLDEIDQVLNDLDTDFNQDQ